MHKQIKKAYKRKNKTKSKKVYKKKTKQDDIFVSPIAFMTKESIQKKELRNVYKRKSKTKTKKVL